MHSTLSSFLSGAAAAGFIIAALFFFRFWRRTRDSLFAAFGIAFLLLAVNQTLLTVAGIPQEYRSWIYILKLAAFAVLILAIVRKNVGTNTKSR